MKIRNPVAAALIVIVAIGALALAFMVGVILLSALAVAGALLGAGLVIRSKLRGSRSALANPGSVRATLDPAMEVKPEPRRIPSAEVSREKPDE